MKAEREIREKLDEILRMDSRQDLAGFIPGASTFTKVAAAKVLLWVLGENDDDRWFITSKPGPPIDRRGIAKN